ncbi:MAG: uroporphyrinogen-III C-methyltransferase, partial [Hyphomicrobiaceae bacterium]
IVDRGDLTVAISSDGAAPMLASHLRSRLEQELDPRLGRVAAIARQFRQKAEARVPRGAARREFWQEVIAGAPARAILAGDEAEGRRLIEAALEGAPSARRKGRVILVGAGPGDPELLTLKAVRWLKAADVILHDALIDPGVLAYARREALVIDVGKRAGSRAVSQQEINALMIEHAAAGRYVVRLKGGDALVFGRAAAEISALEATGFPVEIVPGITAAQACAADVRLPLTLRGRIRQVSLVAGAATSGEPELDWSALARPGQAFAIYMGVRTAGRIAARLLGAGADPSTPAIIVENGSREGRRTIASSLVDMPVAIKAKRMTGPAIVFIGLDWAAAGIEPPAEVEWFSDASMPLRVSRPLSPIDQLALSS